MTAKAHGFLSFLSFTHDLEKLDENEIKANLIKHKKVTVKLGDAITLELSVQVNKEFYRLVFDLMSL